MAMAGFLKYPAFFYFLSLLLEGISSRTLLGQISGLNLMYYNDMWSTM